MIDAYLDMEHPDPIALCYRNANAGVRMSTADIAAADDICEEIGPTGALLIAHAELGIGALFRAIVRMLDRFPRTRIYVPHLGWPANAGGADADWQPAIRELLAIPSFILGVSPSRIFRAGRFRTRTSEWALVVVSQMPAVRIAIASDYPLFEKNRYVEYMSLAREWVTSIHPDWSFAL